MRREFNGNVTFTRGPRAVDPGGVYGPYPCRLITQREVFCVGTGSPLVGWYVTVDEYEPIGIWSTASFGASYEYADTAVFSSRPGEVFTAVRTRLFVPLFGTAYWQTELELAVIPIPAAGPTGLTFRPGQYNQGANPAGMPDGSTPFSLCCLVRGNGPFQSYFASLGDAPAFALGAVGCGLGIATNGSYLTVSRYNVIANEWTSLIAVFTPLGGTLWINGVLAGSYTPGGHINLFYVTSTWLGDMYGFQTGVESIQVGDYRLYDYGLSGAEVTAIASAAWGEDVGLPVRWYPCNELAGTVVHDLSGNADDITLGLSGTSGSWDVI